MKQVDLHRGWSASLLGCMLVASAVVVVSGVVMMLTSKQACTSAPMSASEGTWMGWALCGLLVGGLAGHVAETTSGDTAALAMIGALFGFVFSLLLGYFSSFLLDAVPFGVWISLLLTGSLTFFLVLAIARL